MGIISVRLNSQEEKVVKKLVDYYDEDRSKLLKDLFLNCMKI